VVPDWDTDRSLPAITLNFMPISHVMGRFILYSTLGAGGTAYFAARSDLSSLLDDLALTRPTKLDLVPRIWEMLFQNVQSETDRRALDGPDRELIDGVVESGSGHRIRLRSNKLCVSRGQPVESKYEPPFVGVRWS
jgi:long-subunit acyl-CoA synthetase (AMP-forming)